MPTAEQPRKFLLQTRIHTIEGFLKASARFAVDLTHRGLQSLQCIGEILALAVEILLALGLLLVLADGRQVDLPEALDLAARVLKLRFPALDRSAVGHVRLQRLELEIGGGQLFSEALAAHAYLLGRETRFVQGIACGFHPSLSFLTPRIVLA